MDLDSTMETIAAFLPEDFQLEEVLGDVVSYIPTSLDLGSTLKFLLLFSAVSLGLGLLGRIVLGRRSSLNHALSSAIGILFLYAATIAIYVWKPPFLTKLLSPLPFVSFFEDYMLLFPIPGTEFPALCSQLLQLIMLSFLVNLIDTFVPKGKDILGWYVLRIVSVILSMVLHLTVSHLLTVYLPDMLITYAPIVLLGLLLCSLFLGFLNLVLGIAFTVMDPLFGALYSFFFSNLIGKQISKAVFSSIILCGVICLLTHFGYTVISISPASLLSFVPTALIMLILWYLIGHLL